MILVFRRTGQRRYAVEAKRSPLPDVEMNPAPGYDELMPHDLLHLVVEAQLGLTRGVFGQLAAGGGTFHPRFNPGDSARKAARVRRRVKARGKMLLRQSRDELAQSERATYICWQQWLARSHSSERRTTSKTMSEQTRQVRNSAGARELRALTDRKIEQICRHLDELSSKWSKLKVGEDMLVRWPDLAVLDSAVLTTA